MPLGSKGVPTQAALFENYSSGVKTQRDAWCFNPSRDALAANMKAMIAVYNSEADRFDAVNSVGDRRARAAAVDGFVDSDPKKISWSDALKQQIVRGGRLAFASEHLVPSLYRPFAPSWLYYDAALNERVYRMPRLFPIGDVAADNRVICVSGGGDKLGFSALVTSAVPSLHMVDIEGTQCFPRWVYDVPEEASAEELALKAASSKEVPPRRRDAITDAGLAHFQAAYPGEPITKDDLFHYVYGLLHSPDYRERFADNLSKELPRIPAVKRAEDFRAFVKAGRELGDLHCGFDKAEPYPVTVAEGDLRLATIADPVKFYRVEKMKFAGRRPNLDRTTVIYNPNITITGIPPEAYDYVVNGKPALEWVMERQCVKTDTASRIVSDANAFANETAGDPAYPFKLFCQVITVSLETSRIVRSLPPLDVAHQPAAAAPTEADARTHGDRDDAEPVAAAAD